MTGSFDNGNAAVTVELDLQEIAYQAALAVTSRVLQPSLLDFLR